MEVKKIKEFTNTLYDLLEKGKVPRRNIKRILYDRGKELGIQEGMLDGVWESFVENTYNPYTKSIRTRKKTKEISIIMKGKKTPIIVLNKKTNSSKEFVSQAEAARYVKTSPATMNKLLNEGRDYKDFSVYFKNETPSSVLKTVVIKAPKTKGIEDGPSSFEKAGDPSENNPIISDVKPSVETPKQLPPLEHNLDDARQAYIEALLDKAQKIILKYGIQLEEQEKQIFEDILK
jgi:hypothetical protein